MHGFKKRPKNRQIKRMLLDEIDKRGRVEPNDGADKRVYLPHEERSLLTYS
jgi:hypothetical protein